jgi:toxin ParE1/3/4
VTREVYKRAATRRDLVAHFVYLAENAGIDTADRFLANAEHSFAELAEQPTMGSPLTLKRPEFAGMRKWRVQDFENFIIFYLPRRDGISVVRVLHATRDWWSLLGMN